MPEPGEADLERARRLGRRFGTLIFGSVVVGFTAITASQVLIAVFGGSAASAPTSCREGVRGLIQATDRARAAAASTGAGEDLALSRFRAALEPEWSVRGSLTEKCRADPLAARGLDEVDRLRFGEEHAVRYEAADLARLRVSVRALDRDLAVAGAATSR